MASITCTRCKAKKANRPGKLCYACWVEAGKPTAEEIRGKVVRDNAVPIGVPVLAGDVEDELTAMSHVWNVEVDRTQQHASYRAMKAAGPIQFWDRLQALKKARGIEPELGEVWDGKGPCPTCGYEAEKAIEDAGAAKIMALLDELDEQGAL